MTKVTIKKLVKKYVDIEVQFPRYYFQDFGDSAIFGKIEAGGSHVYIERTNTQYTLDVGVLETLEMAGLFEQRYDSTQEEFLEALDESEARIKRIRDREEFLSEPVQLGNLINGLTTALQSGKDELETYVRTVVTPKTELPRGSFF